MGSWKFFPDPPWDVWSSCGRPVGSEVGGCLHIQLSSLLVRTLGVSLSPTKEWVLALLLLALLPLALPSWVGLLRQSSSVSLTRAFFLCGYSTHGGSLETLPEVGLPRKRC